jgi:hypothetical protein
MRRPLRNAFLLGVVLGLLAALLRARRGGTGAEAPSPALPRPTPALVPPAPVPAPEPVAEARTGSRPSPERRPNADQFEEPGPADDPAGWVAPVDGGCPEGYPVKAKESSRIFHVPGGLSYARTHPDRCYPTPEAAEADGFRPAKR